MDVATKYARSGDLSIAYQVVGDGPIDVLWVPGFVSHLEHQWDRPHFRRLFERYSAFSRFIRFDKRGTGLSDRVPVATLEERMDDVRAVLDAVGSEHTAIIGMSEGGPLALLFAATYPERVTALVLFSSFARLARADDHPDGVAPETFAMFRDLIASQWGDGSVLSLFYGEPGADLDQLAAFGRAERNSATPGNVLALVDAITEIDVRPVLPTISAPTLIVHGAEDPIVPPACAQQLAAGIKGARFVELPLSTHGSTDEADIDRGVDEVEEFLTGVRHAPEPDRVLATVLFTDIVSSTERAAAVGDRSWRRVLERHDRIIADQVARHRGRLVKSTGDGALVTFDGPARGVRCASAIVDAVASLGIEVRAGLHSGEVELIGDDIGGIAVHIGARVMSVAEASTVLVSRTVKDLVVGSGIGFVDRGTHSLKGVPGDWQVYEVSV